MKKYLLCFLIAVLPLMLVACDKKKNNQDKSEEATEQEINNNVETESDDEESPDLENATDEVGKTDQSDGSPIAKIRSVWRNNSINSFNDDPGNTTPPIHQYVFSFCSEYYEFEANQVLTRYIGSPRDFKKSPGDGSFQSDYPGLQFTYYIVDHPKNGFMSCSGAVQFDYRTECCYWKRNDGHHLVAFFMSEEFEDPSMNEHLLAFYDYDPATSKLKPEPKWTDMIEDKLEGFNVWTVSLPDKGKDVKVSAFREIDDDSVEELTYIMKWNGQSFKIESIEDYED